MVCIDDFALKKRQTYGTVMVDIETRSVIDLLNSRDSDDVTSWLKTFPNITLVSRDGSQTYAGAINKANPNIIQVSDRFHLLKNLTDYCKKYITKMISFKFNINRTTEIIEDNSKKYSIKSKNYRIQEVKKLYSEGLTPYQICSTLAMDIRTVTKYIDLSTLESNLKEKDSPLLMHEESVIKKLAIINVVRKLHEEGSSIRAISRDTGLDRKTISRYLDDNVSAVQGSYGTTREAPLTQFHSTIDDMIIKGFTFRKIEACIREIGYRGSASAIRMYTTRKRRLNNEISKANDFEYEIFERHHLIKLLYKPIDKIKEITKDQVNVVIKKYPFLSKIYEVVESFKMILFSKKPDELSIWIEKAKLINISEINSFIYGITRDIEAVKNSIVFDYSNGLAEGSVNKIKVIKRIMYGRCDFETLRLKVLRLEKFRKIN